MTSFLQEGEFLSQWVERPFLYLASRKEQESDNYHFDTANDLVISKLPAEIQKAFSENTLFKRR